MSAEEVKATIRRILEEVWSKSNMEAMDELYAVDFVHHCPPFPDVEGREAYKKHAVKVRSAFPDGQITIDEIILEGDRCAVRLTWWGTNTGQGKLIPIPPTGRQVRVTECMVVHLVDGKAVEHWVYSDWLGLLQQLGVVSPLGQGGE